MRKIQVKELTNDNFREYGEFFDIIHPTGKHMDTFYHDHVLASVSGNVPMAFSTYVINKPDKMIVTKAEYHDETSELILPIDGDIVFHVAPPSKEPVPEETEAFLVPKGTLVRINAGVWHLDSFAVAEADVHALIVLPERTYKRDCIIIDYPKEDQIEIVM